RYRKRADRQHRDGRGREGAPGRALLPRLRSPRRGRSRGPARGRRRRRGRRHPATGVRGGRTREAAVRRSQQLHVGLDLQRVRLVRARGAACDARNPTRVFVRVARAAPSDARRLRADDHRHARHPVHRPAIHARPARHAAAPQDRRRPSCRAALVRRLRARPSVRRARALGSVRDGARRFRAARRARSPLSGSRRGGGRRRQQTRVRHRVRVRGERDGAVVHVARPLRRIRCVRERNAARAAMPLHRPERSARGPLGRCDRRAARAARTRRATVDRRRRGRRTLRDTVGPSLISQESSRAEAAPARSSSLLRRTREWRSSSTLLTTMLTRRHFLTLTGAAGALSVTRLSAQRGRGSESTGPLPPSIAALTSMRNRAKPITTDERRGRIERAKKLMAEAKLDAIILTGGTSLTYFTGIRWGNSERLFAVVIPRDGTPYVVCPGFEEDRAREQLALGPLVHTDVATWQEDESPFERVAQGLKDRGIATGRVGIEETSKFVFADSIAGAAPGLRVVSATPVTAGCRMIKDAHELELMRLACEATLKCYEAVFKALKPGMTQNTVSSLIGAAYDRLGFPGFASVQVGEYTALPHGSITPQTIREGTIIMID